MKIKQVKLKDFKRFDDLTIDLGDSPARIVALVGPNGSGKSSVFDAFEKIQRQYKNANRRVDVWFYAKKLFSRKEEEKTDVHTVEATKADGTNDFTKKSFHIRTAYRFTDSLKVNATKALPDMETDEQRPPSSGSIDNRMLENYERLLGNAQSAFWSSEETTNTKVKEELIGKINNILKEILDIKISNLGNVQAGKGQLYFEKEDSTDFPFENLSSGEKEVVDIVIDLVVKIPTFNETVYCIDEPELHLNTAIQRKLLIEIEKLIPENCQLWVATHSIGFLRAIQEELKDKAQVLDFSEKDYFSGTKTIGPIKNTRKNWQRIFETALEDLVGLIAPHQIVYCEGRPDPDTSGDELGLDAQIYNNIFESSYSETLFVSGGGNDLISNASLALTILSKAFSGVEMILLKDRDDCTEQERTTFVQEVNTNRMLNRREIENYIFDKEVLKKYCELQKVAFNESGYDTLVSDVSIFDFKEPSKSHEESVKQMIGWTGKGSDLKIELSKHITLEMSVYKELETEILGT